MYLGDLTNVARVWRQAEFLSEHYDVVLASLGPASMPPGVEHLELPVDPRTSPLGARAQSAARVALRLAGRYSTAYWLDGRMRRWRDELSRALPVDAIVVNHLFAVPLAKAVGGRVPVVFDAHEHWTSESASWSGLQRASMRRAHEWIVDRFVSETAGMTTVSEGIAHDFRERVGVAPRLVTNAPPFAPLEPTEVHDPIRLIHIGLADERRRLEDTIAAVRLLDDRFTLDLVLARENEYRRRLEQLAAEDERVRVLPPVPSEQLVAFANDYDVGVFLLPARFPNQVHVLPNKLFDYIQARLAVAIGPSQEMARIVEEWDCGVVSASFTPEAFAEALAPLTAQDIQTMKSNSGRAAKVLNADANRDTIVSVVRDAIASSPRA